MSALEKAEEAVRDAQVDSRTLELITAVLAAQQATQQAAVPAQHARPVIKVSGPALAGGVAAALVVGTVLTSLLLALAITACSTAVCALVVRSLLAGQQKRR